MFIYLIVLEKGLANIQKTRMSVCELYRFHSEDQVPVGYSDARMDNLLVLQVQLYYVLPNRNP
jgi:hypothetical protein